MLSNTIKDALQGSLCLALKKKSAQVPGQYYGYSLQCTQCVSQLLAATPGAIVSIEVLEDVATESPFANVEATQIKSGLDTNPIANRSVDLWKTFRNWVDATESKTLDAAKTSFILHVETPRAGAICKRFSNAQTVEESIAAIIAARDELWGTSPTFKKKAKVAAGLVEHLAVVFLESNAAILTNIVKRFRLSTGEGQAYSSLLNQMKTLLVDEDIAEDVLLHGLGWVKKTLDNAIENGLPPAIAVDDFRIELNSFRNSLKKRDYLPTFAGLPPTAEEILQNKLQSYVRQLNIIEWREDALFTAISQYLNTKVNIIQYGRRGYVNRKSLRGFEAMLKALWQNLRDEAELTEPTDLLKRGKLLALRCLRERRKIEGFELPDDFTPGSLHLLADMLIIGWHADYLELLKEPQ
jgi:hypothetical protein